MYNSKLQLTVENQEMINWVTNTPSSKNIKNIKKLTNEKKKIWYGKRTDVSKTVTPRVLTQMCQHKLSFRFIEPTYKPGISPLHHCSGMWVFTNCPCYGPNILVRVGSHTNNSGSLLALHTQHTVTTRPDGSEPGSTLIPYATTWVLPQNG